MATPFITADPVAFAKAMQRICIRDAMSCRRASQPGLLRRLFARRPSHAQREHVVRLSSGETIISNPAS